MPLDAFTAATVLKAISDHRWTDAAKWPIVARIGPQPGLLRLAGAGSERRQGRLVGEDPFALLDLFQHIVGQRLQGTAPAWRAIADTFAPGRSVSSTSHALASADQRRRGRCGLASRRLGTASKTWKLLSS